jgi:hypothetical protein
MAEEQIQNIPGFSRKFKIADDIQKVSWATQTDLERLGESQTLLTSQLISSAISNIQHNSLLNIGINDHHARDHVARHQPGGSDELTSIKFTESAGGTGFSFKDSNNDVVAKIDSLGNLLLKGRLLQI